jgi:hypothetical protein
MSAHWPVKSVTGRAMENSSVCGSVQESSRPENPAGASGL